MSERLIIVMIIHLVILVVISIARLRIIVGFFDDLFHFNMEQTLSRSLVFIFPNGINISGNSVPSVDGILGCNPPELQS